MDTDRRLLSLDVFRGLTIAGMILVNNPGSWSTVYSPLLHADWHGATPTDWVFPFFLFIVGVAIPLAVGTRLERGDARGAIVRKILGRTAIIFGLGLFLALLPDFNLRPAYAHFGPLHYLLLTIAVLSFFSREVLNQKQFRSEANERRRRLLVYVGLAAAAAMFVFGLFAYDMSNQRIPGVLQRIALVYGICSLLFLKTDRRAQFWIGVGVLLSYWALMTLVPVPGGYPPNLDAETNLGAWLDRAILGSQHLWSQAKTWDPEGLLSTLPAIGTGIIGMLTGAWIKREPDDYKKLTAILAVGAILFALGLMWHEVFPINKKIWTSSYVLYVGGLAMLFLGVVYWLVDVLGYKGWTKPFLVFGINPLFAYILSGIFAITMYSVHWSTGPDSTITLKGWLYGHFFTSWLSPLNASLAFALFNVLFCLAVTWILYRRKIYIKV